MKLIPEGISCFPEPGISSISMSSRPRAEKQCSKSGIVSGPCYRHIWKKHRDVTKLIECMAHIHEIPGFNSPARINWA